jgi:hypothetical protein
VAAEGENAVAVAVEGGHEGPGKDLVHLHGVEGTRVLSRLLEGVLGRVHIALHADQIHLPLPRELRLITGNRFHLLLRGMGHYHNDYYYYYLII